MITCPFCQQQMNAVSPHAIVQPAFRCVSCNVRIVVTNQSYLPPQLLANYKQMVKKQKLRMQPVK